MQGGQDEQEIAYQIFDQLITYLIDPPLDTYVEELDQNQLNLIDYVAVVLKENGYTDNNVTEESLSALLNENRPNLIKLLITKLSSDSATLQHNFQQAFGQQQQQQQKQQNQSICQSSQQGEDKRKIKKNIKSEPLYHQLNTEEKIIYHPLSDFVIEHIIHTTLSLFVDTSNCIPLPIIDSEIKNLYRVKFSDQVLASIFGFENMFTPQVSRRDYQVKYNFAFQLIYDNERPYLKVIPSRLSY